jgi:glutamyl-tRNA synthetase
LHNQATHRQAAPAKSRITTLLPLLKERAKTHLDIAGSIGYLLGDGAVDIDDDAAALLTNDAKAILRDLDISLASATWDLDGLKAAINTYLAEKDLKNARYWPAIARRCHRNETNPVYCGYHGGFGAI